jgi:hypothetical protein
MARRIVLLVVFFETLLHAAVQASRTLSEESPAAVAALASSKAALKVAVATLRILPMRI